MISKEDILRVANDLKMAISEDQIQWIIESYKDYSKQYPMDNWSEIIETMLYNLKS